MKSGHWKKKRLRESSSQVRYVRPAKALRSFWQQHSQLSLSLASLSTQRSSLRTSLAHDTAQLARLSQTNVYNDAFTIGHDGGFATINGLRLGRLPGAGRATEWVEINAAWGQTCLLLDTLARKCGVTFEE